MGTILLIEDNERMARVLAQHMELDGHRVRMEMTGEAGLGALRLHKVDLVLTDLKLPGKSGLDVLQAVKDETPMIPVVIMTAHGSIETAVKAVKDGAFDFIQKPVDPETLLVTISKALEQRRLATENLFLKAELSQTRSSKLIGQSRALADSMDKVRKVAAGATTVLLLGESGVGKELFARMTHDISPRKHGPFVAINCAAISRDLLESELFGHERGAFTGATGRKIGKFEMADTGTIFLDEIGDMTPSLQAKVLRVLEGDRFMRVGGTSLVKADVRVVAATNKNLPMAVANQSFREDLYYRLNVFPIVIPPLRDRREDIPLLAEYFLALYSRELKREGLTITPEVMAILMTHGWTGNVRELQNCIERAVILCDGRAILPEHIGLLRIERSPEDDLTPTGSLHEAGAAASRAVEARMIEQALRDTGGNKSKAADMLKVSYKTLLTKVKDYGLDHD